MVKSLFGLYSNPTSWLFFVSTKKVFVLCYSGDKKKKKKKTSNDSQGHCMEINSRKRKTFMFQRWNLRKGWSFEQRLWSTNNCIGYHTLLSCLVSICLHEKSLKIVIRKKQNAQLFPSLPVTVSWAGKSLFSETTLMRKGILQSGSLAPHRLWPIAQNSLKVFGFSLICCFYKEKLCPMVTQDTFDQYKYY